MIKAAEKVMPFAVEKEKFQLLKHLYEYNHEKNTKHILLFVRSPHNGQLRKLQAHCVAE